MKLKAWPAFKRGLPLHSHDNGKTWLRGPCHQKSHARGAAVAMEVDHLAGTITTRAVCPKRR